MEYRDDEEIKNRITLIFIVASLIILVFCFMAFQSCTLSFNNVMTDGTASDVVDSEPKTDADVSPDISFPMAGL